MQIRAAKYASKIRPELPIAPLADFAPPLRTVKGKDLKPEVMWDFRIRHNLTTVQLAERLGVHKSQISRWETRKRKIPLWVEKLLACLDREARTNRATAKHRTDLKERTGKEKQEEAIMTEP